MSRYKPGLDDERLVGEALRALAGETDELEAPPAVEARLRAAFRGEGAAAEVPAPAARPAAWKWVAALASAAGLVGAVYAWRLDRDERIASTRPAARGTEPRIAAVAPAATEAAKSVAARPAAVERPLVTRPLRVADARPERPVRARSAPRIERFEPLYPGDLLADLDAVHVVRLSVPRSSLAALGWPSRPGLGSRDHVELDAMVGPDGMTRAVRFISQ